MRGALKSHLLKAGTQEVYGVMKYQKSFFLIFDNIFDDVKCKKLKSHNRFFEGRTKLGKTVLLESPVLLVVH